MADAPPVVHIGENSPEQVAHKLMHEIANVEKRELYGHGDNPADRSWILDTYAECIKAVRGHR
jgi:hypothetical protein